MIARYYRRKSSGSWLRRVDGNPVTPEAEAIAHAAAEYEIDARDLEIVEVVDGADPRGGQLLDPPSRPAPPDPFVERVKRVLRDEGLIA